MSDQEKEQAVYLQALHNQHAMMVDEMVASHLLWMPEIFHPTLDAIGVIRTIIQLNDGRECQVITFSTTAETTASWKKAA